MTDLEREEFELVATACGLKVKFSGKSAFRQRGWCDWIFWDPKTDDGDALRLAVTLGMRISVLEHKTEVYIAMSSVKTISAHGSNRHLATRLAIWKAAVAYARSLK